MKKTNLVLGFMLIMLFAMGMSLMAQNNCLDFDGTEDYVNCGNSASLNPGIGSFTIESWIKPDELSGTKRFIWKNDGTTPPFDGYYFMTNGSTSMAGFGDDLESIQVSGGTLSAGSWHHVAVVRDVSADKVILYLNGVLVDEATDNTDNINYSGNFAIGGRPGEPEWFDGLIDEVRIWNDARTEAEIRANMCKELAGNESGLVAYYKMSDGSGTSLTDNSTNSNTGTLTNMDNSDWVTSGAAIGDASTYDYSSPTSINLASDDGDDIIVDTITGSPSGVQVYRVDSAPNVTTPPAGLDQLSQSHYFGVFIAGGSSPTYTLTYNYDGHPGISNENNLELASRSNNAATSWTDLNAILNTTNNTLIKAGQTGTEYILASISDNSLPVVLSSFTAQYIDNTPTLCWITQSETGNAGWNIFRGETNEALSNEETYQLNLSLGLIPGAGTTSEPTDYSFEDVFPIIEGTTYFYWLESVDYSGESEIYGPISLTIPENEWQNPNSPVIPKPYGLHQNYPNPFNPNTEISFIMKESCIGELNIYNVKGQKVRILFKDKSIPKDELIINIWNGKDESGKEVSTGVYYYKLRTDKKDFIRKMILIK
ncbi:MAG: T9SS type A sorting domain-containing protein [Armatimonadetes bacterium]|nr:T9SS type A sorting domain-containing protein [Armatimonadota bacterium]